MSNGAEVKGKRLCSYAICSCKLGNRIAKRSMGMDAEGTKKIIQLQGKTSGTPTAPLFKGIL